MDKEELNNCLIKLNEAIDDQFDEKVLKYSNQYLTGSSDLDVHLCKIVSLIKLEKYSLALQAQKLIKEESKELTFLTAYTQYRLQNYAESEKTLLKCDQTEVRVQVLKSQIFNKKEEYGKSSDILATLILDTSEEIEHILEDLCNNYFNSLSMLIWSNYNKGNKTNLSTQRNNALEKAISFCLGKSQQVNLREVFLNLCIFLAIDLNCKSRLLEEHDHETKRKQALELFYHRLQKAEEEEMQAENAEEQVSDLRKDKCIAMVLETIFQAKEKKVRIIEENIQSIGEAYEQLTNSDAVLKACFLSYILYIKTGSESNPDLNEYSKKIDSLLKSLKNSQISKELASIVENHMKFNKVITLFLRGKYNEIDNMNFSRDKLENSVMKHFVLMKRKDTQALDKIHSELTGTTQEKVQGILMQIAVYHQVNNQNRYIELFKELLEVLFIKYVNNLELLDPRV